MFQIFMQKPESGIINLYDLNREKLFLLFFFSNKNFFLTYIFVYPDNIYEDDMDRKPI